MTPQGARGNVALTGATGLVGQFLAPLADLTLGRRGTGPNHRHWTLTGDPTGDPTGDAAGPTPDLSGVTTLIHAAFAHIPGKYRGGEGDNPAAFVHANLTGTRHLFDAAAAQGVQRIIFLSSRAVFDGLPDGIDLPESLTPTPKSLYGQIKAQAEDHLFALAGSHGLTGLSLRATGVYGPSRPGGPAHKWTDLFADYRAGHPIAPRRSTEVHGADLAAAVRLLMDETNSGPVHLSDILLDRHALLTEVQHLVDCPHLPPKRSDAPVSALRCDRLHALGWRPGGFALLRQTLPDLLD